MSEMGYIVRCAILHAQEKLQQTVSQYKILRFDRNRYKHQIQLRIRKQHSECQQDTEYRSLSPDHRDIYFQFYDLTEELFPRYNVLLRIRIVGPIIHHLPHPLGRMA